MVLSALFERSTIVGATAPSRNRIWRATFRAELWQKGQNCPGLENLTLLRRSRWSLLVLWQLSLTHSLLVLLLLLWTFCSALLYIRTWCCANRFESMCSSGPFWNRLCHFSSQHNQWVSATDQKCQYTRQVLDLPWHKLYKKSELEKVHFSREIRAVTHCLCQLLILSFWTSWIGTFFIYFE